MKTRLMWPLKPLPVGSAILAVVFLVLCVMSTQRTAWAASTSVPLGGFGSMSPDGSLVVVSLPTSADHGNQTGFALLDSGSGTTLNIAYFSPFNGTGLTVLLNSGKIVFSNGLVLDRRGTKSHVDLSGAYDIWSGDGDTWYAANFSSGSNTTWTVLEFHDVQQARKLVLPLGDVSGSGSHRLFPFWFAHNPNNRVF